MARRPRKLQVRREIRWMVGAPVAWAVFPALAGGLCHLLWTAV